MLKFLQSYEHLKSESRDSGDEEMSPSQQKQKLLRSAVEGDAAAASNLLRRDGTVGPNVLALASDGDGGSYQCAPLLMAAGHGHADVVQLLLEAGADPNTADSNGNLPLTVAAMQSHEDVARLLMDGGADPSAAADNEEGDTPLTLAAIQGCLGIVRLLLVEGGVDANALGPDGCAALHSAHALGHEEVVRLLLDHGACRKVGTGREWPPPPECAGCRVCSWRAACSCARCLSEELRTSVLLAREENGRRGRG